MVDAGYTKLQTPTYTPIFKKLNTSTNVVPQIAASLIIALCSWYVNILPVLKRQINSTHTVALFAAAFGFVIYSTIELSNHKHIPVFDWRVSVRNVVYGTCTSVIFSLFALIYVKNIKSL